MKLNLGAGTDIKAGYINTDKVSLPGIDVVHNLNAFPWPFKDNQFDEVYCSRILEHVSDLQRTMKEIRRISAHNAVIKIRVPHFSCGVSYRDPTHKRLFSYFTFDYFTDDCPYASVKFNIISRRLNFTREHLTFLNYIVNPIINISPMLYERLWCWILPTSEIVCALEVTK